MYFLAPGIKQDPVRRWALPDRIFFGHGACHILAGVVLRSRPCGGLWAEHVVPADGFGGSHVYVTDGTLTFDYHGYALRDRLLAHHRKKWAHRHGGAWDGRVERVAFDLLSTEALNARKMRGPDQYLHDPIPRAERFIAARQHLPAARAFGGTGPSRVG